MVSFITNLFVKFSYQNKFVCGLNFKHYRKKSSDIIDFIVHENPKVNVTNVANWLHPYRP